MQVKAYLKGGTFVPPCSNACLPFLHVVPVQDRIVLPALGHILYVLFNHPFLILANFSDSFLYSPYAC